MAILPIATIWVVGFDHNASVSYALGLLIFMLGTSVLKIRTRLTDWLGRISYSIYLFHPVVFMTILWWLLQQPVHSWWRTQNLGVYLLVCVALTVAVADGVYRFVEKPCMNLGHRWAARWAHRKRRADSAALRVPTLAKGPAE